MPASILVSFGHIVLGLQQKGSTSQRLWDQKHNCDFASHTTFEKILRKDFTLPIFAFFWGETIRLISTRCIQRHLWNDRGWWLDQLLNGSLILSSCWIRKFFGHCSALFVPILFPGSAGGWSSSNREDQSFLRCPFFAGFDHLLKLWVLWFCILNLLILFRLASGVSHPRCVLHKSRVNLNFVCFRLVEVFYTFSLQRKNGKWNNETKDIFTLHFSHSPLNVGQRVFLWKEL